MTPGSGSRSSAGGAGRHAAILLIGDEPESADENPAWRVPTFRLPLYRWRPKQRQVFTSDSFYGDLDGDQLPEIPVGRLPVRAADEIRQYLVKLRQYESREAGPEDLRTVLWVGIPGYDAKSDALMTPIAMQAVSRYLPPVLTCWWLSGDPRWPCWLPPREQPKRFLAELAAGSVFNFYGGHGSECLALANASKACRTVMKIEDLADLPIGRPAAPLAFLACTIGRFEWSKGPCLGEAMLAHPGGPVAVAAASTESHPLTNYYSAIAMGKTIERGFRSFGEWWVEIQRVGYHERSPYIESVLKDAEGKLEPDIKVPKLRRDQPLMFNILGDPACRLRLPRLLRVEAVCEGRRLTIRCDLPKGSKRACVDLLRPGRPGITPKATTQVGQEPLAVYQQRLEDFNAGMLSLGIAPAAGGSDEITRELPEKLPWGGERLMVRVGVFGDRGQSWAGVTDVAAGQGGAAR